MSEVAATAASNQEEELAVLAEVPEPAPDEDPNGDEGGDGGQAPEEEEPGEDELGDEEARQRALEELAASERALAKRDKALDGEKVRHANRIGEIMGAGAEDLIPCPVCMDGIDGWVYLPEVKALPDEAIARVRTIIGLPDLTTFLQDPLTERCPTCGGRGETKTDSQVPGYEVRTCPTCKKVGYIIKATGDAPDVPPAPPEAVLTGPTAIVADDADPEVRHLRERGFTVIPPIPIGA